MSDKSKVDTAINVLNILELSTSAIRLTAGNEIAAVSAEQLSMDAASILMDELRRHKKDKQ